MNYGLSSFSVKLAEIETCEKKYFFTIIGKYCSNFIKNQSFELVLSGFKKVFPKKFGFSEIVFSIFFRHFPPLKLTNKNV